MEYQLSHEDEKGHGEQGESRDGREDACHHADKARYPAQKKIGSNHVDNEEGEGNRYARKQEEDHAPEKQTDDRVPFHGLPPRPNIGILAPRHSEELDGEEDT